jgi:sec-independent protein translocase protein TatB
MFDIGFLELLIIAVLALLVLGPERLPKAAQTVGRWVGKARRMASTFSQEIDRQLEIDALREQLKEQGKSLNINDDAKKIHETVSQALSEASSSPTDTANEATQIQSSTEQK